MKPNIMKMNNRLSFNFAPIFVSESNFVHILLFCNSNYFHNTIRKNLETFHFPLNFMSSVNISYMTISMKFI